MSISVLLVDDHPMVRKGLRLMIEKEPDMSALGEAGDGVEAIEQVRALSPDVIVMDISMPKLNGIDATRQILNNSPHTKVVALSIHAGKRFVKDMLAAGACGYILKDCVPDELINCIRRVMHNEVYLSSEITGVVVSGFLENRSVVDAPERSDKQEVNLLAATKFTKLHRPAATTDYVHRPALFERLNQNLQRPLTLVVAPAGYGKTMLASCWLDACSSPTAWISLDKNDNDIRLFVSHIIAAVQTIFPAAGRETLNMVNAANRPPVSTLAVILTNELERLEKQFILALDDFHAISDESVLYFMSELLNHPLKVMQLVVISRKDPYLPISRMRAQNLIHEVRTQDLRFNEIETRTFLSNVLGAKVDMSTAIALEAKTEGWVTGLRLAALSMKHRGQIDAKLLEPQVGCTLCAGISFDGGLLATTPRNYEVPVGYRHSRSLLRSLMRGGERSGG